VTLSDSAKYSVTWSIERFSATAELLIWRKGLHCIFRRLRYWAYADVIAINIAL